MNISAFAVYKLESGEINRLISCPDKMINSQIKDGESFIRIPEIIQGLDSTHHVVDGRITPKQ